MSWTVILAMARQWGPRALALLPRVDWRVWAALATAALLLYYGHWSREQGRAEVRTIVAAEVAAEVLRIKQADQDALVAAEKRATEAERLADERKDKIDELNEKAKQTPGASALCVPPDIADGLRSF